MEEFFELDGYHIFAKVEGDGQPLLLLHSYWGGQCLFDRLSASLSSHMKVIRIDLPGHGKSGTPPDDYTFDRFAVVINKLLSGLHIEGKVSVIGHSMGGYIAMAFASVYPERIASLILMHSPTKAADLQSIRLRDREGRLLVKGKRDLLLQLMIPSNFAPVNLCTMKSEIEMLEKTCSEVTLEGALGSIHAINNRANSLNVLRNAQYPILIIIGKYDRVYSATEQLDDASQISNAEVQLLEKSGHLGFMEEEDLVGRRLCAFLEIISQKSPPNHG